VIGRVLEDILHNSKVDIATAVNQDAAGSNHLCKRLTYQFVTSRNPFDDVIGGTLANSGATFIASGNEDAIYLKNTGRV